MMGKMMRRWGGRGGGGGGEGKKYQISTKNIIDRTNLPKKL